MLQPLGFDFGRRAAGYEHQRQAFSLEECLEHELARVERGGLVRSAAFSPDGPLLMTVRATVSGGHIDTPIGPVPAPGIADGSGAILCLRERALLVWPEGRPPLPDRAYTRAWCCLVGCSMFAFWATLISSKWRCMALRNR
jgi:hypothetical protein